MAYGWWPKGALVRVLLLLGGLATGAGGGLAVEAVAAPAASLPIPAPKPARLSSPDPVRIEQAPGSRGAGGTAVPQLGDEPVKPPARSEASWPLPRPKPVRTTPAPTSSPPEDPDAETVACLARLGTLRVVFAPAPSISDPKGCTVPTPITVSAIGSVAVEPPILTTCRFAEALAGWITEVVVRDAKLLLGTEPKSIAAGTSYQCRPRNGVAGGKLSEHGTASALDLSGITFTAGPRLEAVPPRTGDDSPMARFATSIRAGACRHFTTVLGPGSDATHQDHYHFDIARRRNGFRICQ